MREERVDSREETWEALLRTKDWYVVSHWVGRMV